MITPTSVTIKWTAVPGSSGYDVLRDGQKVASTRTALTAKLGVLPGGHVWVVRSRPQGEEQGLNMRLEG